MGEAEGLRRAMSRRRSHDALEAYRGRFVEGAAGGTGIYAVACGVLRGASVTGLVST